MPQPMDAPKRKTPDLRLRAVGVKQPQCSATNRTGARCGKRAVTGATVCATHGGAAPQVRQAGLRRTAEQLADRVAKAWEVVDATLDEGDAGLAWKIIAAQAAIEASAQKAVEVLPTTSEVVSTRVDPAWARFAGDDE